MVTILQPQERATADPGERVYYNISQAAAAVGVSRVSIWRWINAGQLPVARLGHRTARILRDDLHRVVAQHTSSSGRIGHGHAAAPGARWSDMSATDHFVQFYERDDVLLDGVAQFMAAALRGGDAGIVVATPAHRGGIEQRLRADGIDVARAIAEGRYQALDASATLALFLVDDVPDDLRFSAVIGSLLDRAAVAGRGVRVFGEMVALLAGDGNHVGAVELEGLWNKLQHQRSFALYCAYPMAQFQGVRLASALGQVSEAHARVIPLETYNALEGADERLREVLTLQHKARSLEAELEERKLMEDRLRVSLAAEQAARESAEAALHLRDEFVSIASHELKTPLTTLSGYAQLMLRRFNRDGRLDPERLVTSLQAINNQADKLTRLLGHLLDVSRLEEGKLNLEPQPTDLAALLGQVVAVARSWSEHHPITLTAPTSLEANIDGLRFEQVLVNLLDNAVKYSPEGGTIEVSLTRQRSSIEVAVRDHGLGIAASRRAQIFERFYQAHAAGYRSGLGLGLYISRQIVEQHGGQIRAEFPRGGGTRFVVRLPAPGAPRRSDAAR
jgi:excisionase family DNA binding protein